MKYTTKFQLSGLTCGACEKVITKRLQVIEGVEKVQVSAQNGETSIIASRAISKDEVTEALQGTHYTVINSL
ncbi:heavy metal transporter [Candidatus Roizmanbacteria bacterium CG_4_10_14_0_8_um_filter_39_9]|uniref:Heavy metal transporter n=1 Tax=Candidatus Roizmanbacteria bacterium CG_4_10_14_0_8_um_filter_39_9 TaxID=1974829 RepID=A0A2M7QE46_9BACT|nr:MAG: heavy metal transporter [Candidatus Roizmanbacteria bacterium CG_4_10_14_0_8_um_filter_39_9]